RRHFLQGAAAGAAIFTATNIVRAADPAAEKPKPGADTPKPAPTKTAAAATTANTKLNIALIGAGSQGRSDMKILLAACKQNVVAICDADERQIAAAKKEGGEATASAAAYTDYRKLLDDAKTIDAVLIATPDHWHAPL